MTVSLNNKVGLKLGTSSPANVDLSTYVQSATLTRNWDALDISAMGDGGHRYAAGLESSTLAIDFLNDDGATGVLQTLNGFTTSGATTVYFKMIQDTSAAISASNPVYTGQIFVNSVTPINGATGDIRVQSLSFDCSGTTAIATTGTW